MNSFLKRFVFEIVPVLLLILVLRTQAHPQGSAPAPDTSIVILNHADSLIGLEIDGEQARKLSGNVQFTQGKTVINCERAIEFRQTHRVSLEGEVIVRDDSMALYTNRGMYYSDSKMAEGFDNVRLQEGMKILRARYGKYYSAEHKAYFKTNVLVDDSTSRISANELTYYRDQEKTIADGAVRIDSKENGTILFGEHFENDRKTKYSLMTNNPRAWEIDTTKNDTTGALTFDTLFVRSERMEAYQDSFPRLITTGSVSMKRGDFASESGQSIFYTKLDSIVMQRTPFVWFSEAKETTQLSGDSIFAKLRSRKLERLYVRGDAFAASQADSVHRQRYNQMSGREIIIQLAENAIRRIDVDRTATMLYYVFDGAKPNGLNKTTGDHGVITFVKKKIDKVKMTGGVEGQYYPEKMVRRKEHDFNLAGFNWRPPSQDVAGVFR